MKAFYCIPCDKHPVTIYEVKGHTLMRYNDKEEDYKRMYKNTPIFFCYTCGSVAQYRPEVEISEAFKKKIDAFNVQLEYRAMKQANLQKIKNQANKQGAKNVKSDDKPSKRLSLFEEE